MKFTLSVLAFACFVGAIYALPLQQEDEDAYGTFLGIAPESMPNFEEDGIVPFPSTIRPPMTTTTSRPAPTTSRPRPTRPPQIHDNALKSQGPFSGRLNNVVLNREGVQKTVQRNRIGYNINSLRRTLEDFSDNETSQ